jgi:hypothetical protein
MKTLAWQQFFSEQREHHGKVLFRVAELANVAHTSLHALNTELGRLVRRGLIARYAQGVYGPAQGVGIEPLVAAIDSGGYITGFYALFLHGMVTQAPTAITCFTNRRHNRQDNRVTPAGRLEWVQVPAGIYQKPSGSTSAEQALCDFFWLMLRAGLDPRSLVTFRNLHKLKPRKLSVLLQHYPEDVKEGLAQLNSGK